MWSFRIMGEDGLALDIVDKVSTRSVEMLGFYERVGRSLDGEASISLRMLRYLMTLLKERGYTDRATWIQKNLTEFFE